MGHIENQCVSPLRHEKRKAEPQFYRHGIPNLWKVLRVRHEH